MLPTMAREIPCYTSQFGTFYIFKKMLAKMRGIDEKKLGGTDSFIAGGASGMFCWGSSYP